MDSDAAVDATLADLLQTSTVVTQRVQRRDPNAVITHQATQWVQYGYFGKPVNRVWSRWSDGRVTHSDNIEVYEDTPHGRLCLNQFVNIGCDEDMLPPADLDWRGPAGALYRRNTVTVAAYHWRNER